MLSTVLAALAMATLPSKPAAPEPFLLSVQAWTFNHFSLFEAIEKTAQAGGKAIEMFPGQTLRPASDVKVGPDMPEIETAALEAKLKEFGIRPVAFGVTGISKDPAEARVLFRWAKRLHLLVINTESVDAIDTIEAMVKEFDIKVGFHDHPKQAGNPGYKMWDPAYVYSVVKDRDQRIGSCADTGHWVRSGIKPIDAIKMLHGRIVSSHLKDLNAYSADAHDVPFGTGVSDIPAILETYKKTKFNGPASIEYEYNWDNSIVDVANCIGFVRGYLREGAKP